MSNLNVLPDKTLIEAVAQHRGIAETFVEKDWYVTQAISVISNIKYKYPDFEVVFSGGTALSKAYHLLRRFSEDIDFKVIAPVSQKRAARSSFKKEVIRAMRGAGFQFNDEDVQAGNDNKFFVIKAQYPTSFQRSNSLRSHLQLEMTIDSPQLSHIYLPIQSFVCELMKKPPEVAKIACINPAENAADKLSAISWRIPDRTRGEKGDDPAVVRHIHDLSILKERALKEPTFSTLVKKAMDKDDKRCKNNLAFSGLPIRDKFKQLFDILDKDREYLVEYKRFVEGASYAGEDSIPAFEKAVKDIKELAEKVLAQ